MSRQVFRHSTQLPTLFHIAVSGSVRPITGRLSEGSRRGALFMIQKGVRYPVI
jgi:hypothetical protein